MFDKVLEQFQNAMKPASELMTLNAKALEQLVQQQTTFLTGAMNDSVAYTKEVMSQKDITGIYKTQKEYLEGMKENVVSASKDTYSLMADTQEKAGELLKGAFNTQTEAIKTAAKAATEKATSKKDS